MSLHIQRALQVTETVLKLSPVILFLCKQARLDIEPLVSFLATRVKELDEDAWGKLKHGLGYLKGTLYMKRHMKADSLSMIR